MSTGGERFPLPQTGRGGPDDERATAAAACWAPGSESTRLRYESVEEIVERLDRLQDHGFITSWRRERSRWYVECGPTWGPYNAREIAAWVEGANAMGAAPSRGTLVELIQQKESYPMTVKASQISFNEGILRLAQIHGKTVEFRYEKGKDKPIETRVLTPTSITVSEDGNMSFVGYDSDRDAVRSFRVDRIRGEARFV